VNASQRNVVPVAETFRKKRTDYYGAACLVRSASRLLRLNAADSGQASERVRLALVVCISPSRMCLNVQGSPSSSKTRNIERDAAAIKELLS